MYEGMFIPKGATVIANVWQLMHSDEYPDPEEYKPERFLVADPPTDPFNYAFGFGRRACPGKDVASATAFLSMSTLLHSFSIQKAKDASGKEITPELIWSTGLIAHAPDHPADITPRSPRAAELIRQTHLAQEV